MNGKEILTHYLNMLKSPEMTYQEMKKSSFYENELTKLAVFIANEQGLSQTEQLTFQVDGRLFYLSKCERYWEITLPYTNPDLLRQYKSEPPVDLSDYVSSFHYHYYKEIPF